MNYNFDWSVITSNLPRLLDGLGMTLWIAVVVIVLSMLLAIPVAFLRMSNIEVVRWLAQLYIEIFRCTPLLVQLFWVYYAMPTLTGITIPGTISAIIALTLNLTAFMAEAYRSGFQAVPIEQVEAGKMLRLSRFQQIRYIIVPQAMKQQLPVIMSLNISLFKDTALVSTIAVADLMFTANKIATESYRALEILTAAALIYFVIAFPASLILSKIERNLMMAGSVRKKKGLATQMLPGGKVKVKP
ncbi:polar amino acid transport system permease protein [Brevibacterium sanguinis]|uniref:Polar amino acid transport system permease protein n=2 Tax=Brevibacterium TaxID=1696 RepID=A0A366IKA2_9MICO|nr:MULTISPECIES: amino acid ABC transporter permease [Brevibacterium]RBP65721.1 polar amino acid transport system permease protein [Brevibacterium sanguinis]RBP72355.1 polar amino acid transport system permease protein [Brevibacterium celere]